MVWLATNLQQKTFQICIITIYIMIQSLPTCWMIMARSSIPSFKVFLLYAMHTYIIFHNAITNTYMAHLRTSGCIRN